MRIFVYFATVLVNESKTMPVERPGLTRDASDALPPWVVLYPPNKNAKESVGEALADWRDPNPAEKIE